MNYMKSGIYKLTFSNCSYVYIGQAKDIVSRVNEHIQNMIRGTASYKLIAAYVLYGIPKYEILVEATDNLDELELSYISEYNSVENGLNIVDYAISNESIRVSKGYMPNGSKYTEEQYYNILMYCIDDMVTETTPSSIIAEALDVSVEIVHNIRTLVAHTWLKSRFPEEYNKLIDKFTNKSVPRLPRVKRKKDLGKNRSAPTEETDALVQNSIHSKYNEFYPDIESPMGDIFSIKKGDLNRFAKKHKLNYTALHKVLSGKLYHEKGWKLPSKFYP